MQCQWRPVPSKPGSASAVIIFESLAHHRKRYNTRKHQIQQYGIQREKHVNDRWYDDRHVSLLWKYERNNILYIILTSYGVCWFQTRGNWRHVVDITCSYDVTLLMPHTEFVVRYILLQLSDSYRIFYWQGARRCQSLMTSRHTATSLWR